MGNSYCRNGRLLILSTSKGANMKEKFEIGSMWILHDKNGNTPRSLKLSITDNREHAEELRKIIARLAAEKTGRTEEKFLEGTLISPLEVYINKRPPQIFSEGPNNDDVRGWLLSGTAELGEWLACYRSKSEILWFITEEVNGEDLMSSFIGNLLSSTQKQTH